MSNNKTLSNKEIFDFLDSIERKKKEYQTLIEHFVCYRVEATENDTKSHLSEQINKLENKIRILNKIYPLLLSQTI